MRITNKIMQNNQMYNINNNKVYEDSIATQVATGKKINRPSEDPVVAIRALRLRSTVNELKQYYDKNAKDAESWLKVTEGALDTVDEVLTDLRKLVVSGPDKYKTLSDWDTIVNQIEALSNEYYSTGNVDYAGRYVFTGYRTNTPLTFTEATTLEYTDIQDEFNGSDIDSSYRVLNMWDLGDGDEKTASGNMTEKDMEKITVGRLRLSYDNINVSDDSAKADGVNHAKSAELKYRVPLVVPAASSVQPESANIDTINLSFTDEDGIDHVLHIPTETGGGADSVHSPECTYTYNYTKEDGTIEQKTETYTASKNAGEPVSYTVQGSYTDVNGNTKSVSFQVNHLGVITSPEMPSTAQGVLKGSSSVSSTKVTKVQYTPQGDSQRTLYVPLSDECKQPYTINTKDGHTITVNTDGTYTLADEKNPDSSTSTAPSEQNVVQITSSGAVHSSYLEYGVRPSSFIDNTTSQKDVDEAYKNLVTNKNDANYFVMNAATGELLLSDALKEKLETLTNLTNAKTIDVVYDKSEFKTGDTRPEHLFNCTKEKLIFNSGTADHIMRYDVGYNQEIEVNTMADEIFTTNIRRYAEDLRNVLSQMKDVDQKLTMLNSELAQTDDKDERTRLEYEIDAAKKAYDTLTEIMKDQFSNKITRITEAADAAGTAVTVNGTRSRRLELITSRLMDQTETFKELAEDNEGIDLAEAATNLATAELAYQASLQATGKIIQTSLMDYI